MCGNVGHEVIASNVHNVLRWPQDGAAKARVGEGSVVEHVIDELQQEEEEEGHATMLAPCRDCATHTLTNCCPSAQVRLVFSFYLLLLAVHLLHFTENDTALAVDVGLVQLLSRG